MILKSTGIVRRLDDLGRLVIPKDLRTLMNMNEKYAIEIYTADDNMIVLKKFQKTCVICNSPDELFEWRGVTFCKCCLNDLKRE